MVVHFCDGPPWERFASARCPTYDQKERPEGGDEECIKDLQQQVWKCPAQGDGQEGHSATMSIYATQWVLKFPAFGDAYDGCDWVMVLGQGVPAHIGTPTPGYGYEEGDPYASFLPPAIPVVGSDNERALRAMVVVREKTEKDGQKYIGPLLVLSGDEYEVMPFQQLHDRICDALRGRHPRLVLEIRGEGGRSLLMFDDDSVQEIPPEAE